MDPRIQDEPSDVCHEPGIVFLDGPCGCVVTMSPQAARETGRRLLDAAEAACRGDDASRDDLPF